MLLYKILKRINKEIKIRKYYIKDIFFDTRSNAKDIYIESILSTSDVRKIVVNESIIELKEEIVKLVNHQFDLLGSGLLINGYYNNAKGFCGNIYSSKVIKCDSKGNFLKEIVPCQCFKKSKNIWNLIPNKKYDAINWQKDIISGYEWNSKKWYYPIEIPKLEGVDIKIPWELGRLQHLPRLAICYLKCENERTVLQDEFESQLMDFCASNPVRWGVQSMCSMDIGIRLANIVLAYSIMKGAGCVFNDFFENMLANMIYDYGKHIYFNLEKSDKFNNNHYLGDLLGLVVAAVSLANIKEKEEWLNFSQKELIKEFENQFNTEGTNREGSSAYHLLSTELIVFSFILLINNQILNMDQIDFERIIGGRDFINALTTPNNKFTLIGDNDSGRVFHFFKDRLTEVKDILNVFIENSPPQTVYGSIIDVLILNIKMLNITTKQKIQKYKIGEKKENFFGFLYQENKYYKVENMDIENVYVTIFEQFGVFVWKSNELYLCVNMSDIGQNGQGGHSHNDKMSFELYINGKPIFIDPGTYVYTASIEKRNLYRSVYAHNVINTGVEQNEFKDVFSMNKRCFIKYISVDKYEFVGIIAFDDVIQKRIINITKEGLYVHDYSNKKIIDNKSVNCCFEYGDLSDEKNN